MTFQPLDRDLDDDELVELERFLASPVLVDTSMDLYGVDGYFAAILIAPPPSCPPSGWPGCGTESAATGRTCATPSESSRS